MLWVLNLHFLVLGAEAVDDEASDHQCPSLMNTNPSL